MQKYPQYKLQPTSIYGWRFNTAYLWLLLFILPLSFLIILFLLAIPIYDICDSNSGWHIQAGFFDIFFQKGFGDTISEALWNYNLNIISNLLIFILALIPFLIPFIKCYKKDKLRKSKSLPSIADYIQEYKYGGTKKLPKYVFFVKDNKFGVMNVTEFKVAIPAQYDEIAWREPNRILTVTKGSETYDIDIFGNQLR